MTVTEGIGKTTMTVTERIGRKVIRFLADIFMTSYKTISPVY